MMKGNATPTLIYCYDALCGWCYGFSAVMGKLYHQYNGQLHFEVLSGGMVMPEHRQPIGVMAAYIQKAYKTVEETTGVRFGPDYLWHIFNPQESDWALDSVKPAVSLCIFKEYHPQRAVEWASALQHAHMYEGRDLTDNEAYRHLLPQYNIPDEEFYTRLRSEEYKQKAYYEFALVKQLQVTGYPTLLLQASDAKFYLLGRGYTDYETINGRLQNVLADLHTQAAT